MINKNDPSKAFLKYGSIISFILDKAQTNTSILFPNYEENFEQNIISNNEEPKKEEDIFLTSEFLYSQGVFNEYSFFYKFKDITELKYNYYNSLFLVLPKGDFDSLTKLRALKRQLKNEYIIDNEMDIDRQQIIDTYTKFKQEIYTNQQYSIKILTTKDNYVNFNDCVRFMHIKSGKFLEYNQDPETLKLHICLTETPSENTIFRFVPAFNYQGENSAKVMNNLILKIACGSNIITSSHEKFISKREKLNVNRSIIKSIHPEEEKNSNNDKNKNIYNNIIDKDLRARQKSLMFGNEILLNALKKVDEVRIQTFGKAKNARASLQILVNDNQAHEYIKNNFKSYINISSIPYKNFGKKIIPDEDETVTAGNTLYNYWRVMIFSKNFFEDNKFINSLDCFSIQNNEKNLFIQAIDSSNKFKDNRKSNIFNKMTLFNEEDNLSDINNNNINNINNENNINNSILRRFSSLTKKSVRSTIRLNYFYNSDFGGNINYDLLVNQFGENDYIEPLGLFKFEFVYNFGKYGEYEQFYQ